MRFKALLQLALSFLALFSALPTTRGDELNQTVRATISSVAPSVVRIRIIGSPAADELSVSSQVTTGICISDKGDVLTSVFGLTSKPAAVFVEDSQGQRVAAKVVAKDHVRKLALLKCEEGSFDVAPMAEQRWPKVGEWAVALGRLFPSKTPAASVGIISAVSRIHGLAIQTDAKISPVNYGGPLVNLKGRVTGILVPLSPQDTGDGISAGVEWYDSGIGFAIPIEDALQAADALRSGTDRVKGVIGVRPSTRNPLETEVSIDFVFPKSPAEEAGLQKGDRIIAANGINVARFGVFDSIAKSSYAGEPMSLTVKRGDQTIETNLTLAAEIERPVQGFLGIIISDPVEDDDSKGVRVFVLPSSPAAAAGLPSTAILTGWNDESLDSVDQLQTQFRTAVAGSEIRLTFRPADGDGDSQQVAVQLPPRPEEILSPSDEVVEAIVSRSTDQEWGRREEEIEDIGKVWMFAPKEESAVKYGVVCLLSESQTPPDLVVKLWKDTCQKHNLIIAIPVNSEETALTREDRSLIPAALGVVAKKFQIDTRRVILAAEKPEALLCSELLLEPRLRQFRAAVFLDCWPQISGLPPQILTAKSPSVLLVDGAIQSRQATALRDQARAALKEAGVWTISVPAEQPDQTAIEDRIAAWALNLKAK